MSRIRSVHPGMFTDEAFMTVSSAAKVVLIGIWCECDDQGVFEWKPFTLKARLLPAEDVNMDAILSELASVDFIRRFECGKSYGLVRNFQRYQRPKKPNAVHPLPDEYRTYVGAKVTASPPVPHQFGTGGGEPPLMEDVVRRMEEGDNTVVLSRDCTEPASPTIPPPDGIWTRRHYEAFDAALFEALGAAGDRTSASLAVTGPMMTLVEQGCDFQADILPTVKAKAARSAAGKIRSWSYIAEACVEARNRRLSAKTAAEDYRPPQQGQPRGDPYRSRVDLGEVLTELGGAS